MPGIGATLVRVEPDDEEDPEWASYMLGKTLLGRLGRTGVDIVVDGGMKVW